MDRWQNQEEAFKFSMAHNSTMLNMDMGTGKTRVALDVAFEREDVHKILIVCPKAVIPVWRENLQKFHENDEWECWDLRKGTVKSKAEDLGKWLEKDREKSFVVINYDSVWRKELGDLVFAYAHFDLVILDESHRAKAAGSKVSKFLSLLGRRTRYKMCLSGTPMANSPLDVYGQYRFLDPEIYGTRHDRFLSQYAVMGGPDLRFIVGFKNQQELINKFNTIAYTCKMSDIRDRLKLPDVLPDTTIEVDLPSKDLKTMRELSREFVAECGSGHVAVNNMLVKLLRLQQITSGFCEVEDIASTEKNIECLNSSKQDALQEILEDIDTNEKIVVFCNFRYDLESIHKAVNASKRECFELSGSANELNAWKECGTGAVLAVQIQAGSEGVSMVESNHAIYYNVPHSLAMYSQSKARLYRPGQKNPVHFLHMIARDTVDVAMYRALQRKEDIVESIKTGTFDFGYIH